MKVTGLAISPPSGAADRPCVTPELLASSLARYSRSNQGIDAILANINRNDPDKAVDHIFRFVDYGHASIGGLTGGIAIAIDNCSMFLALKLFEIAQFSDGQESSTRYIEMSSASLPEPQTIGIPDPLRAEWQSVMEESFRLYREVYQALDQRAREKSDVIRVPANASLKIVDRLRRNYALDRSRYLIPFATLTNVALVMTARAWAQTIRQLDGMPLPEAQQCSALLRSELQRFTPRLVKHSFKDHSSVEQGRAELEFSRQLIKQNGVPIDPIIDKVFVAVDRNYPKFLPDLQTLTQACLGKENRYCVYGEAIRRIFVRFAWNNVSVAEVRDLNRHRSGHRFTPLNPVGFYVPPESNHPELRSLLERHSALIENLVKQEPANGSHFYAYLLGEQVPFEHSTHADKFIYEVELRTGLGAHFRYAEHLSLAYKEFLKLVPEAERYIHIGSAEPE